MVTFISCELESREILAVFLRDDAVRLRLENASSSWGIEYAVLLRRIQVIIAMALFSAHRDGRQADSSQAALDTLRVVGPVELFGVLPTDQENPPKPSGNYGCCQLE